MLSELDQSNKEKELLVSQLIANIKNMQYLQMRITISTSHLTKEQIKYLTAKMAEANLTLCHVAHQCGTLTSKYRHMGLNEYIKMSVVPDTLSYPDGDEAEIVYEYLTNCLHRLTGLLLANQHILSYDKDRCNSLLKSIYDARRYSRDLL